MKGIILAGGSGTRLYPLTISINKQLLPIYDKPMIFYPLSTLMLAGIRDILVITTEQDAHLYKTLLKDGSQWGINISYAIQEKPNGLAEAFIIGEEFIGNDSVCLVLGDNIFHGHGLSKLLMDCAKLESGAYVFGYRVHDPERYGVVSFDENNKVISIVEKPKNPQSQYAVAGLYFYDNNVIKYAKSIKPSERGELEITDINNCYLREEKLSVVKFSRGIAWLDTGTHDSLLEASAYIRTLEKRQNCQICCPDEIAFERGYITKEQLKENAKPLLKNSYGKYLMNLAAD